MHIGYAVKQADWGGDLAGLPLETEVVDARNTKAQVKRIKLPAGGFGEFTYPDRLRISHRGLRDQYLSREGWETRRPDRLDRRRW